MPLNKKLREQYSRMLALADFTDDDLEKIMSTTLTVIGAGGLGSPALRLATALGFGKIRILDHDVVDLSNLQRQTVFNASDIGQPKAIAAIENLSKMNPDVEFEPILASINQRNAVEILKGTDIILDGLDTIHARRAVNIASQRLGIPYVYQGAIEYYGNLSTFIPRKTGCFHCLIGDAEDDPNRTCATVGVTPTLLSVVSAIGMQECVLLATEKPPNLAGRLMHIDLRNLVFESFEIQKQETCPVCGTEKKKKEKNDELIQEESDLSVTMMCTDSFNITPAETLSLDLEALGKRLESKYNVKASRLFLAVNIPPEIQVTIMKRGTAVVKGVTTPDEAIRIYKTVLGEDLTL